MAEYINCPKSLETLKSVKNSRLIDLSHKKKPKTLKLTVIAERLTNQ